MNTLVSSIPQLDVSQSNPIPALSELVETNLRALTIDKINPESTLAQAIKHQFELGGSRTRTQLSLNINDLLEIPKIDCVALATVCELLHQASLIHDDLQDKQISRREQPTLWYKFGKDSALCAGDFLISAAYAALADCQSTDTYKQLINTVHHVVTQAVKGQMDDVEARRKKLPLAEYEILVQAKSGSLLALPLELALAYQKPLLEKELLRAFFADYTLAYQALDDLEDYPQDWLAENALQPPNLLALMRERYGNLDLAYPAVQTYIENILARMDKIIEKCTRPWQELLLARTKKIRDQTHHQLKKKNPQKKQATNAVVIGGGFGGIAAALRLSAKGYQVKLIDKMPRLGGRAQVYSKNGFRHDAGPTVITAPFLLEELFALFGKKIEDYIELKQLDLWYRFVFADGSTFDYGGSVENTLAEIARLNPHDKDGYLALLKASKAIFSVGFQQYAAQPFHQLTSMVRSIPHLIRLRSHRTVWQLVCKHIQDPRLRQAFSIQPLLVGGNPFDTSCIYSLIHYLERKWGVAFPMGGTGALVDALTRLLQEQGVDICLNTKVEEIKIENKQVQGVFLENGDFIPSKLIVSNADPTYCYSRMIAKDQQHFLTRFKTKHAKYSMGLFILYFGTMRSYPEVAHHTIWLGKRYQSLLKDIFDYKILSNDFSMYIHRPTATDSSFAPAGCESFYVLVPVPNLQGEVDWDQQAKPLRDAIVDALSRTILPGLAQCIVDDFYKTPHDFKDDYLSMHGAGFSISPLFRQSAWFRYHNRAEGIKGLYHVGAGTHPGAGIPGVLSSAKIIGSLIKPPDVIHNSKVPI